MRYLLFFILVVHLFACTKIDNNDDPVGDPVLITYDLTADTCNVQPYMYSAGINGYIFGSDQVVDSFWVHNETFYVQNDFRRGGVRIQLVTDTLHWRLKVLEEGTMVWDTTGVTYRNQNSPLAWFKIMKDW